MTQLKTQAEAMSLAQSAGFSARDAEVMAAIAMAETFYLKDGKPFCDFDAIGDLHLVDSTWGPSYGAWQIRSVKAQRGTGGFRDPEALAKFNALFNAKSARAIFLAQGFGAWSTYNSGAWKGYMLAAVLNPKPELPAGSYIVTGGDTLSGIGAKTGFSWQRIAEVNHIAGPKYTIYPGNVLLLPEFPYTVVAGDNLTTIAAKVASDKTWQDIWQYNKAELPNPNLLRLGQVIKIPRF